MLLLKLPKILPTHSLKFPWEGGPGTWWLPCHHPFIPSLVWPKLPSKRPRHREVHQPSPPPAFAQEFRPSHYSQAPLLKTEAAQEPFLPYTTAAWCSVPVLHPACPGREGYLPLVLLGKHSSDKSEFITHQNILNYRKAVKKETYKLM